MEQCTIDIEETKALADEAACIFRVGKELRNANRMAYTPILISIGPYHHGRRELLAMEKRKEHYLKLLLQRNNNQRMKDYLDSMKKLEERARKYYADPVDDFNSSEFVKMMLYDACFVIEFLFGLHEFLFCQQSHVGDEVKISRKRIQICSDLMLLENQLPFFVISEIYDMSYGVGMTHNPNQNHPHPTTTLTDLAFLHLFQMLPRMIHISINKLENMSVSDSKHFLDLVHNGCRPSSSRDEYQSPVYDSDCFEMPCVTVLQEAGVKFEAVEDDDDYLNFSMFDIRFNNGHFKIPKFQVTDSTETFFRNIIAYEQHSSDDKPKYFTDYTYFMDQLINCKEGVTQLRRLKVLENSLGDDEVVALMFNNLSKGTIISQQFYYVEQCSKGNAHCKRWQSSLQHSIAVAVAPLKRDYFTNIWVSIATIAGAFLLLLTLIQTVIALITILTSCPSPSRQ